MAISPNAGSADEARVCIRHYDRHAFDKSLSRPGQVPLQTLQPRSPTGLRLSVASSGHRAASPNPRHGTGSSPLGQGWGQGEMSEALPLGAK